MKKNITLLVTSAIAPPENTPLLNLTSKHIRHAATKAALMYWMTMGIERIVIVDSTNHYILDAEDLFLAENLGIKIEQLKFNQNYKDILTRGKGYGEALLIAHALEYSELLNSSEFIYKCTGKLFVNNFHDIKNLISSNNVNNLFWRWADGSYNLFSPFVDTRFYFASIDFLKNELISALLQTDEFKNKNHEHQAYEIVTQKLKFGISIRPIIIGIGGGSGNFYPANNYGPLDTTFPCWHN